MRDLGLGRKEGVSGVRRDAIGSSAMAELPAALFLLAGILLVFINLISLAVGWGTSFLIAIESASHASKAASFADALNQVTSDSLNMSTSVLGRVFNLKPSGGNLRSGADLYIVANDIYSASLTQKYGPNLAPVSVDLQKYVYECETHISYEAQPLFNLSAVPYLADIPGLGKPFQVVCTARRMVENTNLLGGWGDASLNKIAATSDQTRIFDLTVLSDWDYYHDYSFVLPPGQSVEQIASSTIYANPSDPAVASAGNAKIVPGYWMTPIDANGRAVTLRAGQRLSIDVTNAGWYDSYHRLCEPATGDLDANRFDNLRLGVVEGLITNQVDASGVPVGTPFGVGCHCFNFESPTQGKLYLRFVDNSFKGNSLSNAVTITVTQ